MSTRPEEPTPSRDGKRPYNPLDKIHLGESVARAVLSMAPQPLPPQSRFDGAGVYLIYYTGDHPAYGPLAARNRGDLFEAPIYIGKAIPAGARKGLVGLNENPGRALYKRLCKHANSITLASNLENEHFFCRYIVVDDIWIPLSESLLITRFQPPWNVLLDGFGNNDPGGARYDGVLPSWDVVHPGRGWAAKCKPNPRSAEELVTRVQHVLASRWA